ncbi:MAG: hypothetical protein WA144_08265 [Candidatus Methanoperedens sp.]
MYKGHIIGLISDQNIKIWRYMKYKWFEKMLMERKLHFTRVDRFDDKFEGWVPGINLKRHTLFEKYRTHTYANCWHEKDHESNLMWEKYSKDKDSNDKGIVIQSTFKRLVESLRIDDINDEYIDRMKYIDSDIVSEIEDNIRIPFFLKRKEYDDEHEIRAIIQIMNPDSWNLYDTGIDIPILLDELIENIYIFPQAPRDFYDSVQAIVNKCGLRIHVNESCLSRVRREIFIPERAKVTNISMLPNDPLSPDQSGNFNISHVTAYVIDQIPYNNKTKK